MAWRLGVDSGGTFTDVCLFNDETGQLEIWKTPSTPDDPSRGIADVVSAGLNRVGGKIADLSFFGHGTTVATNALIELHGAKTGLITTDGFRDLLEIGRQRRPNLYDMMAYKPPILASRENRIEVPERIRADGSVDTPLDLQAVGEAARALQAAGVQSVAICFLYGFLNPEHEKAALAVVAENMRDVFISVSSAVAPEYREFERLSTTVVNAYLGPIMQSYISGLDDRLTQAGMDIAPHLTQSNGGVIGLEAASLLPVRTLLSGPSTGVVAAQVIAEGAGFDNLITFDVGGTSSDVALLERRTCKKTGEAKVHGYPIKAPMLDIHTVGAGGGSIACIDSGGLLIVGPESAGADPGPVCYGLGGTEPTVTDANIVLKTLNPVEILGGRMKVEYDLAHEAISDLADKLGLGVLETAQGIIAVATANMVKAIRLISVRRGHDPRDYALMAFGGGGPLHAARLARELGMSNIIVPPPPGTLCALGLLLTDLKADFAKGYLVDLTKLDLGRLIAAFAELDEQGEAWFGREGVVRDRRAIVRTADLRYVGQNYELQVSLPVGQLTSDSLVQLRNGFEAEHQQRFGFIVPDEPIELVTLRVEAIGVVEKAELRAEEPPDHLMPVVSIGSRMVFLPEAGGAVETPIYTRSDLVFGHTLTGPAIVEQMDTTTLILPGMTARVDAYLNLILETKS